MSDAPPPSIEGPFGPARYILSMKTELLAAMYRVQCGADIKKSFHKHSEIQLYRCNQTGMQFWRPDEIAGNEAFYQKLSDLWPNYYRDWRWEYGQLDDMILPGSRVLEIGCGRGYFLRYLEQKVAHAEGLEFNRQAIENKVTTWDILPIDISKKTESHADRFDLICHFQVLEHVVDSRGFLEKCVHLLKPGGKMAFSVPNYEFVPHSQFKDPFDLPPHHMSHFTPDSLKRIANYLDVDLVFTKCMPRQFEHQGVSARVARRAGYRAARFFCSKVLNLIYQLYEEPGHTMIAVYKKLNF